METTRSTDDEVGGSGNWRTREEGVEKSAVEENEGHENL